MAKRQLYISATLMAEAVKDKHKLDALALAVSCKMLFVNSTIKDASVRRMMALFGVGYARCKRAIANGEKFGYFIRKENALIAASLKEYGAFNVCFRMPSRSASRQKSGKPKAQYSLTQICNFIREAVLINQISKQQDLFDTLSKTERPQNHIEYKRAKKKLSKRDMQAEKVERRGRTLSYAKMSEHIACSRAKAKRLAKGLTARKTISMQHNYEETGLNIDQFNEEVRREHTKYGDRGFLVLMDGMVVTQIANSYTLLRDVVRYIPKRKPA